MKIHYLPLLLLLVNLSASAQDRALQISSEQKLYLRNAPINAAISLSLSVPKTQRSQNPQPLSSTSITVKVLGIGSGTVSITSDRANCSLEGFSGTTHTYQCSTQLEHGVNQQIKLKIQPTSEIRTITRPSADNPLQTEIITLPEDLKQIVITGTITQETEIDVSNNEQSLAVYSINGILNNPNQLITTTYPVSAYAVADVNNDNFPDLVVSYTTASQPQIFINNRQGHFLPPQNLPGAPLPPASAVLVDDIDLDQRRDILFAYPSRIAPEAIAATAGGIRRYEANTQNQFIETAIDISPADIRSAKLVNLDSDNYPELIVGNFGHDKIIDNVDGVISQTNNEVVTVQGHGNDIVATTLITVADFTEDNTPDILFGSPGHASRASHSQTGLNLRQQYPAAYRSGILGLKFGDSIVNSGFYDADDDSDLDFLAVAHPGPYNRQIRSDYLLVVKNNNGALGSRATGYYLPISNGISDFSVVDADQDRDLDVYLQFSDGEGVLLTRKADSEINGNSEYGVFPAALNTVENAKVITDSLDGSPYPDLIAASTTNNQIAIFLNPATPENQAIVAEAFRSDGGSGSFPPTVLLGLLLLLIKKHFTALKTINKAYQAKN